MHDGKEFITTVEDFDAQAIVSRLNDREEEYHSIGDIGFTKHAIKYFATSMTEEPPTEV